MCNDISYGGSANITWLHTLASILARGQEVAPRGKRTKELLQHTVVSEMTLPVVTVAARKLSYQFMAAEAYWILSGDNTVAGIAPWNQHISQFSDDGKTFFGAYGPPIHEQLDYVVSKLQEDPDTRQAVLTIWRPNPPATKDVPCTVAMSFMLRHGTLNLHVFMRSSDAWLGLPYDTFNFSVLGALVCGALNLDRQEPYHLGRLYLTLASSHLYEQHWQAAAEVTRVDHSRPMYDAQCPLPLELYQGVNADVQLMVRLKELRDTKPGDPLRWWEARP